jgi:hypothetical protein
MVVLFKLRRKSKEVENILFACLRELLTQKERESQLLIEGTHIEFIVYTFNLPHKNNKLLRLFNAFHIALAAREVTVQLLSPLRNELPLMPTFLRRKPERFLIYNYLIQNLTLDDLLSNISQFGWRNIGTMDRKLLELKSSGAEY